MEYLSPINSNLVVIIVFVFLLLIVFWIMPNKKSAVVVTRLVTLLKAISIYRIIIVMIELIKLKK